MQRIVLVILALLLVSIQPTALLAQDADVKGTWDDVKTVPLGEKLEVKLKTGKTDKGALTAVSDSGLSLAGNGSGINIARDDVRRVHRVVGRSSKRSAIFGAAAGAITVGAGLGALLVAQGNRNDDNEALIVAMLAAAGAGVGALAGYALGKRKRLVLIYQSQ